MRLGQCDHGKCRMKELGMSDLSSSCFLRRMKEKRLDFFHLDIIGEEEVDLTCS